MSSKSLEGIYFELPVLRNRDGDIKKRWYIEYYGWDAEAKKKVRQVLYCPLRFKLASQRKEWAKEHILEITGLLMQGYYNISKPTEPPAPPAPPKPTSQAPAAVKHDMLASTDDDVLVALEAMVKMRRRTLKHRAATTYNNAFNRFAEFYKACELNLTIKELGRRHAYQFSDFIVETKGNSNLYRNHLIADVNTLLNDLVEREIITESPFAKINALPERVTRTNIAFTASQQALLETYLLTENPFLYACTRYIYQTFIRPIEVMQLQVRDIDLPGRRIGVHGSIAKTTHAYKTDYVEITRSLADVIHDQKLYLYKPTDYVFSEGFRPGPKPKHRNLFTTAHSEALRATELYNGELTGYSWKHTGVVNAFNKGAKIEWLQRQCRHTKLEQTVTYMKSLGLLLPIDYAAPDF